MRKAKSFRTLQAEIGLSVFSISTIWQLIIWILDYFGRYLLLRDVLPPVLRFLSYRWTSPAFIAIGLVIIMSAWSQSDRPNALPNREGNPVMSLIIFVLAGAIIGAIGGAALWTLTRRPLTVHEGQPVRTDQTPRKAPTESVQSKVILSDDEKQLIVKNLATQFKKEFPQSQNNSQTMIDWINTRLAEQNNDFRVAYQPLSTSHAGILVTGSKDVKVEGNDVTGVERGIVIRESSQVSVRNNKINQPPD
jgi:parallel beta-helix repeat protein